MAFTQPFDDLVDEIRRVVLKRENRFGWDADL